jgi:adenosine kinase
MGSIKIGSRGGQNHKPSKAEIEQIYSQALVDETMANQSLDI